MNNTATLDQELNQLVESGTVEELKELQTKCKELIVEMKKEGEGLLRATAKETTLKSIGPVICPCGSKDLLLVNMKNHSVWKQALVCNIVCPKCSASLSVTIKPTKKQRI